MAGSSKKKPHTKRKAPTHGLTPKQHGFALAWLNNGGNGYEAAKAAGYQGSYNVLCSVASENLRKPKIRAFIDARLEARAMSKLEVLDKLAAHASADMADFTSDANPKYADLKKAKARGKLHLIKELRTTTTTTTDRDGTTTTTTNTTVKLHDSQAALDKLMRAHGGYKDILNVQHEGKVGLSLDMSVEDYARICAEADAEMEASKARGDD